MAVTVPKQDAISFVLTFAPKYRNGATWAEFTLANYVGEAVDGSTMTPIPDSVVRAANPAELASFVSPADVADTSLRHLRVFLPGGPNWAAVNSAEFRIILVAKDNALDRTTIYADQVNRV